MRFWAFCTMLCACSEYSVDSIEKTNEAADDSGIDPEEIGTADPSTEPAEEPEPEAPIEEGQPPNAVCTVSPNPVSPPFEEATFDGSASTDPNGGTLSHYWELISTPEGTAYSSFDSTYANTSMVPNFMPDVAGEYLGRLTVTNEEGLADTCDALLQAIPSQNLWVELFWVGPNDDLDLHLIAPGANWSSAITTDQDCYYGNCVWSALDWGQYGYAGDDPILDLDDIPGVGPENINISDPQSDGAYTVVIHDYPGSVYSGVNDATVNIYLDGALVWSVTRGISVEDSYTPIATIDWATRSISGL
jgi:hypothetical protein